VENLLPLAHGVCHRIFSNCVEDGILPDGGELPALVHFLVTHLLGLELPAAKVFIVANCLKDDCICLQLIVRLVC